MPTPPKKGEDQKTFIARCIKHVVNKEGKDQKQAAAICYSMWRKSKGQKDESSMDFKIAKAS